MTKRSVALASFELATKPLPQKRGHEGQIRRVFQYNITQTEVNMRTAFFDPAGQQIFLTFSAALSSLH
jgi:hypothetical protein